MWHRNLTTMPPHFLWPLGKVVAAPPALATPHRNNTSCWGTGKLFYFDLSANVRHQDKGCKPKADRSTRMFWRRMGVTVRRGGSPQQQQQLTKKRPTRFTADKSDVTTNKRLVHAGALTHWERSSTESNLHGGRKAIVEWSHGDE